MSFGDVAQRRGDGFKNLARPSVDDCGHFRRVQLTLGSAGEVVFRGIT